MPGFRDEFCEFAPSASRQPTGGRAAIDAEVPLSASRCRRWSRSSGWPPWTRQLPAAAVHQGRELSGPPRPLGDSGRHVAMRLSQYGVTLRAVAFGAGDRAAELAASRAARCRLPPGHQLFPRPQQRGTALGRLAAGFPVGERPPSRAAIIGLCTSNRQAQESVRPKASQIVKISIVSPEWSNT